MRKDQTLKLLFVNYEFPPLGGGGGRANEHIARQMVKMGHEVVVVTSAFKELPRNEIRDGVRIHRIATIRSHVEKCTVLEMFVFMFSAIFSVVMLARRWRPDMCIAFFTIPSAPAAYVLKRVLKVPYIVSLRGGDVPGFLSHQLWFYHFLTRHLIRFLWKGARAVVANSEGLRRLAQKTEPIDIKTIPNGVDTNFFGQSSKVRPRGEPFRILSVGRLTAQKGMDTLLRAFRQVRTQLTQPVQLWIVGDGPLREDLEGLRRYLNLDRDVFFVGWQEALALKEFYSRADLFVLSSLDEGMPNAVLEAMATGLPVVATDVSGTRELIAHGHNGYLIPPNSVEDLSHAILRLIQGEEDLLDPMGQASLLVAQNYNWQKIAGQYLSLCENHE